MSHSRPILLYPPLFYFDIRAHLYLPITPDFFNPPIPYTQALHCPSSPLTGLGSLDLTTHRFLFYTTTTNFWHVPSGHRHWCRRFWPYRPARTGHPQYGLWFPFRVENPPRKVVFNVSYFHRKMVGLTHIIHSWARVSELISTFSAFSYKCLFVPYDFNLILINLVLHNNLIELLGNGCTIKEFIIEILEKINHLIG